jgi:hypothetical protein
MQLPPEVDWAVQKGKMTQLGGCVRPTIFFSTKNGKILLEINGIAVIETAS